VVKILSQAGSSLADTYDVEGSIAGIEQLETRELPIVHEMGGTVFSERASGFIRLSTSGAILQSTNWDNVFTDLPAGIIRILGFFVFSDDATRITQATLSVRGENNREVPIFAWDSGEGSFAARIDNGGVADIRGLGSNLGTGGGVPSMLFGIGQPQRVPEVAFRGTSTAFGAGTVTVSAFLYLGFSEVGGISSRGLPVPSW